MPRPILPVLLLAVVLTAAGAAPAAALRTHRCPRAAGFRCATVTVPLDRSGTVPGTVGLAVAIEDPRKDATGYLMAFAGGPGQPAVPFARSFRASLGPALAHRRLVLFDGRGTGGSGVLRCGPLQALRTLDKVNTYVVERCAVALGTARQFYATTDTVLDAEAVRAAIGAPRILLMGISYGTYVAEQYARRFPAQTEGLILDSVVGPDGLDAYTLDSFERLRRVLAEQCGRGRCRGATKDPGADLARLAARLQKGPLRGRVPNLRGVLRPTAVHDQSELLLMLMSGDLNPFLQAALPGAVAAAVRGDAAPLLRLRRYAQGPRTPADQLSAMLNVTTNCSDARLPYTFATPFAERWDAWLHGVDAVPPAAYAPFSQNAVIDTSLAHDCLRWPFGDAPAAPSTDPLPDVPALLLSGRLDIRTPIENAREVLALLPHGQLLTVGGTGHDVLDTDITGCAARALRRFADGRAIGRPCVGRSNAVIVQPRPPRSLRDYRSAPGVGGQRGRVLFAALDTVTDAQLATLETLYAGFSPLRGGGLRGGRFSASDNAVRLRLHRYEFVPGLGVSGVVSASGDRAHGTILIDGPGRLDGRLHVHDDGRVNGVLGGRPVRYDLRGRLALAATAAGRGARAPLSAGALARAVAAAGRLGDR